MSFLDIALRNAARGFRIIPLRGKEAFLKGWPVLATTDASQIQAWAEKFSDYNCGVAGGSDVIILDSDRVSRLRELSGEHAAEWFHTYAVSSGRPDRAHFYFLATPEALDFGNRKWKEQGIDGHVFEVKGKGTQVTAEGSVHPDTGGTYAIIQDLPLIPFPAGLLALLREIHAKANPTGNGKREWALPVHDGEGRDDFLTQQAGRLRHVGASEEIIRAHLAELNADPDVMADPKSEDDLDRIARSIAQKPVPAPVPVAFIGSSSLQVAPEEAVQPERKRPVYPVAVWDGTAAGEFAKLCAHGNNVPRKMYIEAFRCILGAVVGDRVFCPMDGGIPRSYVILIAPAGKGKGSAISRAVTFFQDDWASPHTSVEPGLLFRFESIWRPQGIGAFSATVSSAPGMVKLLQEDKKLRATSPHLCWNRTIPRIISVYDELKNLLSSLFIEGGTGKALDGVICSLWDHIEFAAPATDKRPPSYGQMQFSLLGAVTEEDWRDLLSRSDAVGGGLMSRLTLIGTEGQYEQVEGMFEPDFTGLRESFLPRVRLLADARCRIEATDSARQVIREWLRGLPEGTVRMNVQAWRYAILLSWLKREDAISEQTARDAVLLGQYQVDSHEYYLTSKMDNPLASIQDKIIHVLTIRGPLKRGRLQDYTHARRVGTELWNRALEGLIRDGRVGKREDGTYYLAARN